MITFDDNNIGIGNDLVPSGNKAIVWNRPSRKIWTHSQLKTWVLGPILLTRIYFNTSMDK